MQDYITLFQNIAFPVAICIVLLVAIGFFTKKLLIIVTDMLAKHDAERIEIFNYMKATSAEQAAVIRENTETNKKVITLLTIIYKELKSRE